MADFMKRFFPYGDHITEHQGRDFTIPLKQNAKSDEESLEPLFHFRILNAKNSHERNEVTCGHFEVDVVYSPEEMNLEYSMIFGTSNLPLEVMDGMFSTYNNLLDIICSGDSSIWNKPLSSLLKKPAPVDAVAPPMVLSVNLMHEGFVEQVREMSISSTGKHSDGTCRSKLAVIAVNEIGEKVKLSYSELDRYSSLVSSKLYPIVASDGVGGEKRKDNVVAVIMEKGWEQVVAVLGILRAQSVYLPIDARLWSEQRIRQVLGLSSSVAVLTQSHVLSSCPWLANIDVPVLDVNALILASVETNETDNGNSEGNLEKLLNRRSPSDLAYLIYTSGSTGEPKGVCCHHGGAMNTIVDLNERFSVEASDRILALSSLSFDLSVYDIFGVLSVGGTIVIPNGSSVNPPDPGIWLDLLVTEEVTMWNTVPAFMELLVSHAEFADIALPSSLRLVLMSGDWIPVSLPSRIRAVCRNIDVRVISLGGATEASIWSNMFELGKEGSGIPNGWSSVPYGRPLRNQSMLILNDRLEHCEVWVTGSIYIGGVGVAYGYYKNEERTAYQFVIHPESGERLFRTGDLGRVRPGGLLEILGREDSQVKVNGFRIELGEVERVLTDDRSVASAALAVHSNSLCAYLTLSKEAQDVITVNDDSSFQSRLFETLRQNCRLRLTDYMVPQHFMILEELPLSSNGKVMREKLPHPVSFCETSSKTALAMKVLPRNIFEGTIRAAFAQALRLSEDDICCEFDTFFALGGNSLSAIQLIFSLRSKCDKVLGVQALFNAPTIQGVYQHLYGGGFGVISQIDSAEGKKIGVLCLNKGNRGECPLLLINPAGASGLW